MRIVLVAVLCLASAAAAVTLEAPVPGALVAVTARGAVHRRFTFRSAPAASVDAPFSDPTTAASLRVFVSSADGQCHAEIALPAAHWKPIGNRDAPKGWRYRDRRGGAGGVRAVTVVSHPRGGRIVVTARGAFPCGLEAAQAAPLAVVLRLGSLRYCATFGGTIEKNAPHRFRAVDAPAPAACPKDDVTVADLNVLHGIFCADTTAGCRRADRVDLVRQWVVARGCPDVVAFEEVFHLGPPLGDNDTLLAAALANACPAPYAVVYRGTNPFDEEMILSRHPVLLEETLDLLGPLRDLLHVRIDHPAGALDVYATHLASGSDLATSPCGVAFGEPCPPECVAAGAATVRDCQAVQVAAHVAATHDVPGPALVVGDLNESPGSFVYQHLASRGWTDAYLAAGNPECAPATGVGCTSGRIDDALTDMESPALGQVERIDYVWLVPPAAGSVCEAIVDGAGDGDGDGFATRLFADEPNPFAPACGPAPAPICWPSDHSGVQADVDCS